MDVKYIGGDEPWTLPFGDHFYSPSQTSVVSSPIDSNDIQTIARRYDFQALSSLNQVQSQKKSPIPDPNARWMNAGVFFTDHTIESTYSTGNQTEYHDDHGHTFCYLCSINAHDHERTQPRPTSERRKLIPYNNPKALKARPLSADRSRRNPSSDDDLVPYRFIVRTDSRANSGTRAQVYLYIYGTETNWTSINLHARSNGTSTDGFPSGSIRTFCLKGPEIGQLHHLNVNLVGARSEKEWFLKEIEITNLKTSVTWLCQFNCWLPKKHEENPVKPTIERPKPTVERPPPISFDNLTVYILQVHTGGKAFAGTDSTIDVCIRGSISVTRSLPLVSDQSDLFEQNQLDTFIIVGWDLGELTELIVKTDNSQMASEWDLKEMIMWKILPRDDSTVVYFPFNQWLGDKTRKLKAKSEIYPSTEHRLRGPICYFLSIKTGSRLNAGTDANVYIQIYGKTGRSTIHHLDNIGQNDFERGSTCNFTIMDTDVGPIDSIRIWHDDSGPGAGWYLETVTIRKKHSLSRLVSTNFIVRLEKIAEIFYNQARDKIQQFSSKKSVEDRDSTDRQGNGRSILRSPIGYDRGNTQKKVTWDKKHLKDESIAIQSGHFEHNATWISSHNYINNKWEIKSLEEKNRDLFDSSTRTSLLSDRSSTSHSKTKISTDDKDDDTYEFEANRWLAKDEGDKKVEVILKPKSNRLSSQTNIEHKSDTKKKSHTDLRSMERSPRDLSPSTRINPHDRDWLTRSSPDQHRSTTKGTKHIASEPTLMSRLARDRLYSSAYGTLPE